MKRGKKTKAYHKKTTVKKGGLREFPRDFDSAVGDAPPAREFYDEDRRIDSDMPQPIDEIIRSERIPREINREGIESIDEVLS